LELLRTSNEIKNFIFICRFRKYYYKDVLDPGVSWYLVDADSTEQTEFRAHKNWCRVIMQYQKQMTERVGKDLEVHATEWRAKPFQPVIQMQIIEGRKMERLQGARTRNTISTHISD
jgi:hypothetical protein